MSMKTYNSLRKAEVIKTDIEETELKAAGTDSNEIKVVGVIWQTLNLYIVKTCFQDYIIYNHQWSSTCTQQWNSRVA